MSRPDPKEEAGASKRTAPCFLITVDTEGDNLWADPTTITTHNAAYLPRFQTLCEKYGLRPTWLTNHEMAECPAFCDFAADLLSRNLAEVGMHLHAWNSPPSYEGEPRGQAYLTECGEEMMRGKIRFMTELLEQLFQRKMVSHRAGRWGFDRVYARILVDLGYLVDCSVTPLVSWKSSLGDPGGNGGPNYSWFPPRPYFLDLDRIDRAGTSPLLEIPVSIVSRRPLLYRLVRRTPAVIQRAVETYYPPQPKWLFPERGNLSYMLSILETARRESWPCVEMAIHSSELMPGSSPKFPDEDSIEAMYEDLEALFSDAQRYFSGATLAEFYRVHVGAQRRA